MVSQNDVKDEKVFRESGADAEQTLGSIRIVKAFGQEKQEIQRFNQHLSGKDDLIKKQALMFGISKGLLETVVYFVGAYSLLIGGFFITSQV